ncbi:MAG: ferredoxin [Patescibacteria group bacterium]
MTKVIFEKEKCIGCGSCASICPSRWSLGEDGKASLREGAENEEGKVVAEIEDVECNREAAQSCPVQCISVED